jgi:hypothetical protein
VVCCVVALRRCCCWGLACNSWWARIWDHTFVSFYLGGGIPNLLCTGWLTTIGCPSYSESGIAERLHQIDVGLRAFIKNAREQAERKADLYREAFIAESQAQGDFAKEQVQRKYAAEISQARDAKAYADGKIQEYQRIKAQLEGHLKAAGVCKYQDIDPASGKKMRMLSQVDHHDSSHRNIAAEAHPTSTLAASSTKCSYLGPGGADYRGLVDHTGDGTQCLPWPKGWAAEYHGSGLAKDMEACSDLPSGSRCWEACLYEQETNNFCRNPRDAKQPECRTGGTDEAPIFTTCANVFQCEDDSCTHDKADASDYSGEISFTVSGKTCKDWKTDATWREQAMQGEWQNHCRNPDGKKLAWCFVDGAPSGWEFCNVGRSCEDPDESVQRVAEAKEAGPVLPFPKSGLHAHYTTRGWEKTAPGQWDDESGNARHRSTSAESAPHAAYYMKHSNINPDLN